VAADPAPQSLRRLAARQLINLTASRTPDLEHRIGLLSLLHEQVKIIRGAGASTDDLDLLTNLAATAPAVDAAIVARSHAPASDAAFVVSRRLAMGRQSCSRSRKTSERVRRRGLNSHDFSYMAGRKSAIPASRSPRIAWERFENTADGKGRRHVGLPPH
jgi:hypothetical protein